MCVVLIKGALLAGLGEVVDVTSSTYRGPSCRCRRGGSCMARHSIGRPHATRSHRSPPQTGSSCRAGPGTSSHTATGTQQGSSFSEMIDTYSS